MEIKEVTEAMAIIDELKPIVDELLDEYGPDIERYMNRMMASTAKIQGNYWRALREEGFTPDQAYGMCLSYKAALSDAINKIGK